MIISCIAHNLSNGRCIIILDAPPQSKGQQFLGQRLHEHLGAIQQCLLKPLDPVEFAAVSKAPSGGVDGLASIGPAPAANGVKMLSRKPHGIHMLVATGAGDIGPMLLQSLTHGKQAGNRVIFQRGHVRRGWWRWRANKIL